jgi:hypothetical protein
LFSLTDIFATVAGIVDQPLSGTMAEDSLNILPSLRENKPIRTEAVYHAGSGALGLRDKNWVYLRQGGKEEPDWYKEQFRIKPVDSPALLFDLSTDEGEKVNLYHQHTKRALAMEARLQEIENSEFSR